MNTPKSFCTDTNKIKAFVLGCDPTAFDKDENRLEFEYVFDLGNDERYFSGVVENLKQVGLSIGEIYVQNLVTDYQNQETGKNHQWEQIASGYIAERKKEFDKIDPKGEIPVFLTSEVLYKVLLNPDEEQYKASQLYNSQKLLPISAKFNLLSRPLIPLYRHWNYKLKKWPQFSNAIKSLF